MNRHSPGGPGGRDSAGRDSGGPRADGGKRERILDAAVRIFADKGFYNAKVSEIAREAGVADGTIYLYFKSKDDLLISLFEARMADVNDDVRAALASAHDPVEKLRAVIRLHLSLVERNRHLAEVLTVELRQSARFMKEYSPQAFAKYLALVGSILEEGQKKGVFRRNLDPAVFRRALFGAIDEISLEWVLRAKDAALPSPVAVGEQISEFILRGLRV